MADALLSTPVALAADALAVSLLVVAGKKVAKSPRENMVALMGVLGACVFAAQMVNFAIPGTGSSGHIIGGIFLSAIIGPWAAFLTISSVLIVQCLVFADGGLMALGCNILNMGAMSCLVAYPLIFKPLIGSAMKPWRLMAVSILACVVGLELGALFVTAETTLSGVTALSGSRFLLLMSAIHLAIGVIEGVATGAILCWIAKAKPELMGVWHSESGGLTSRKRMFGTLGVLAGAALVIGGVVSMFASSDPDGLEWSIFKMTGSTELASSGAMARAAEGIQSATAVMPGYENTLSGIVGTVLVLIMIWAFCSIIRVRRASVKVKK